MATDNSNKERGGNSSDSTEFLQDLRNRYRYLYELQKKLDAISDETDTAENQMLRKEFAYSFADVMTREVFVEHLRRKGELFLEERPSGTA